MRVQFGRRSGALLSTVGLGVLLAAGAALADGNPAPSPPSSSAPRAGSGGGGGGGMMMPDTAAPRATRSKAKAKKKKRKSEQQFYDGYRRAYAYIQAGQYEAGIAYLKALGQDDHPDVANYLGFSSRKLGRYDEAKYWYEVALAADPNHTRTWQYYGMWHLAQGNMLKAQDHLAKIKSICGADCPDYASLKGAIEGTVTY